VAEAFFGLSQQRRIRRATPNALHKTKFLPFSIFLRFLRLFAAIPYRPLAVSQLSAFAQHGYKTRQRPRPQAAPHAVSPIRQLVRFRLYVSVSQFL